MTPIERLEPRRLFAALVPDLAWGYDGAIESRKTATTFVAAAGDGLIASHVQVQPQGRNDVFLRYTAAGAADPAFTPLVSVGQTQNVVADTAGRLYASPLRGTHNVLQFTRYTRTGRVDRAFGQRGTVSVEVTAAASNLRDTPTLVAVTAAPDGGTYVAAAYVYSPDALPKTLRRKSAVEVFRLAADGTPVQSFGENGRITLFDAGGNQTRTWLATDPAGRLLVGVNDGGTKEFYNYEVGSYDVVTNPDVGATTTVRRYAAGTGAPDATFGDKRHALVLAENTGRDGVLLDGDGRILAREGVPADDGSPSDPSPVFTLRRYVDGRTDPTYGTNGAFTLSGGSSAGKAPIVSPLLPQRYGKVLVKIDRYVYRLTADGYLDRTFDGDGIQAFDDGVGGYDQATLLGQLRDGSLIARIPPPLYAASTIGRLIPKVSSAQLGSSGTLYVNGSAGDNDFRLRLSGDTIAFDSGGHQEAVFATAAVKAVRVELGDGRDTFDASALAASTVPMTVNGYSGDKRILTGGGRDIVTTFDGHNTVSTGAGKDYVDAGDGTNVIRTGGGNDVILNGAGHDTIDAGAGNDYLNYNMGDFDEDTGSYSNALADRVDLGPGDDYADFYGGNNTVLGGDGRDTIYGGKDGDSLDGGAGDDAINGYDGDDTLLGGDGRDDLDGSYGNDRLTGGASADRLTGGPGRDTLFGNGGNDFLSAGPAATDTRSDVNRLDGGVGFDRYLIENANDVLTSLEEAYTG